MSYSLQLVCDHEGCAARWPPAEIVGLSFGDTTEMARAAGWSSTRGGRHLCARHVQGGAPVPPPPDPVDPLLCEICSQAIPGGYRRTKYCSMRCAWEGRERQRIARAQERKAGAETGRTGPCQPETAKRLARLLGAER